jgi:hypothetical protein
MTRKSLPITVTLDADGNMVISAEQRRALGLEAGQYVTVTIALVNDAAKDGTTSRPFTETNPLKGTVLAETDIVSPIDESWDAQ